MTNVSFGADKELYKSALADFDQAAILSPKSPEVYEQRSHVHIMLGHPDLGMKDLATAGQLQRN